MKKKLLGYLDALKFFAALAVMTGTLFDAVLSENDFKVIQRGSPLYIFRQVASNLAFILRLPPSRPRFYTFSVPNSYILLFLNVRFQRGSY